MCSFKGTSISPFLLHPTSRWTESGQCSASAQPLPVRVCYMSDLVVPPVAKWQTIWSLPDSQATQSTLWSAQPNAHWWHTLTRAPSHVPMVAQGCESRSSCCHPDTPPCTQENGQKLSLMRKQGQTDLIRFRAGPDKRSDQQVIYTNTPFYPFSLLFSRTCSSQTALIPPLPHLGFHPHPETARKSHAVPKCCTLRPIKSAVPAQAAMGRSQRCPSAFS